MEHLKARGAEQRRPRSSSVPLNSRRSLLASGAGATVVVALIALAPSGIASGTHGVWEKGPYRGTSWYSYTALYVGGCGSGRLVAKPHWNASSGLGTFSLNGTGRICGNQTVGGQVINNYADVNAQFRVAIPLHVKTSGAHLITANWTLTRSGTFLISSPSACLAPTKTSTYWQCSMFDQLQVFGYANIQDLTNGSYVTTPSSWPGIYYDLYQTNGTSCYGVGCSGWYQYSVNFGGWAVSGNTSFAWVFNASAQQSMNASHQYILNVVFYGDMNTGISGYAKGTVIGAYNMATLGNGWKLNYIHIS